MGERTFPTISDLQFKALTAMRDARRIDEDFSYLCFAAIQQGSGIPKNLVRRTVRALARKGLAEFASGLSTIDGEFRGSGYRCTKLGSEMLTERNKTDG